MWTRVRALWLPQADLPRVSQERWVLLGEKVPRNTQSYSGPIGSQVEDVGGLFRVAPWPESAQRAALFKARGEEAALEAGPPPPTRSPGSQQTNCVPSTPRPQQRPLIPA